MKILALAALCAASVLGGQSAWAQRAADSQGRGGFLVQTDLEFGGDTIATVAFDDGETQNVHAGQGISIGIGGYVRPVESTPFELSAVLGYKYVTTAADNADINVSRVVLKANATWWFDNGWFVTGGVTHHASPELDGDGFFEDIPFDNATGFSAEVGWRWIALRYTKIEYSHPALEDIDASSVGLSFTWRFSGRRGY